MLYISLYLSSKKKQGFKDCYKEKFSGGFGNRIYGFEYI